ncbi:MAG: glycosyltransferase family 39 protein [Alphaproteobacteria bacterium]|jgi:4-amino-4-deoxy-L-arabinose transferase-like glycosyltransferase|nr:MAG: glycosyltransferase family 39 protein [Alphaproteobacteria bacterium]
MDALSNLWRRNPTLCAAIVIAMVVLVRIAVVIATPMEIGPDESQYWRWSRTLDFGYYSKPPLIAWIIAASTAVFGDGEWAIRLPSPILHGIAAMFLFLLGKQAFNARVGAWAAALYLLMPGITLSSTIMSTDAVLLPAWAGAIYFLWRFRDSGNMGDAILAGAMIGLAMLGKYAALYLWGGAALAALLDRDMRKAVLSPAGVAMVLASLVVWGPNIWWNFAHDFATVSHTADNANLGEAGFNPLHVFTYLGDQAAVFGPISLLLLLAGFALILGRKDKWTTSRELWLLAFVAPPLIVIMGQEILSRAHANWAATAYPGACVLLASWIDRGFGSDTSRVKVSPFLKAGVALNAVVGIAFMVFWLSPSLADSLRASSGMKGVRGWEETVAGLDAKARELGATAILVDDRELWHGIDYYSRNIAFAPLRTWLHDSHPRSHAEEAGMLQPGDDTRLLIASIAPADRPMIRADFASTEPVGYLTIPLGPTRARKLKLYLASGYKQAPRVPGYEKQFEGRAEE